MPKNSNLKILVNFDQHIYNIKIKHFKLVNKFISKQL